MQRYLRLGGESDRRRLSATVGSLAAEDPQHPPLYYLAGRLWVQFFGDSPAAVRSLAAVFGVLALPLVYWLCLEVFASEGTALVCVALVAVSPFFVLYSQEAREYSLWTAMLVLDACVFLRASRAGRSPAWIAYAAITAAALYVYPLTGLVAIGFGAFLFVRDRARFTSALAGWLIGSLAALAAFLPWLTIMRSSRGLERGMAVIMHARLTPAAFAAIFARDIRAPFFDIGLFKIGAIGSTAINLVLTAIAVGR